MSLRRMYSQSLSWPSAVKMDWMKCRPSVTCQRCRPRLERGSGKSETRPVNEHDAEGQYESDDVLGIFWRQDSWGDDRQGRDGLARGGELGAVAD